MQVLTIAPFATNDADFASVMQPYLDTANDCLKPFDLKIEVFPTGGPAGTPRRLPFTGVVVDSAGDPGSMRQMAHTALPVGLGIPVIFCKLNTDDSRGSSFNFGETVKGAGEANGGTFWLPYIMINTQIKSSANEVLLHEMIHASYTTTIVDHDADTSSVFYKYGSSSDGGAAKARKLPQVHADSLRKCYFARYV